MRPIASAAKRWPPMPDSDRRETVLVTGGTGFVGVHCILQLLRAGYEVRTTVRSLARSGEVAAMLGRGGLASPGRLSFVEAVLEKDDGWTEAARNCRYVLHVASPIGLASPKDENEVIVPAVQGALRALRAARDAGVRRVVLTSSFAAVGYSPKSAGRPFTEGDWTDPRQKNLSAYVRSKTLAEKAAWDFMQTEGGDLELSVINPTGIFGPTLGPKLSSSLQLLQRLLDGSTKTCPRFKFGIVDVRDVADLHLRAMTHPEAKGERFLAVAGKASSPPEIAKMLKAHLGPKAGKVTAKVTPDWAVRAAAWFSPTARAIAAQLGREKEASNEKARRILGWRPRSNEEAILAGAESLFQFGLIKL
jgi:nucleoside-diphosphate-sugar epimerase